MIFASGLACAHGDETRLDGGTQNDSVGTSGVTLDTIDPTVFSTSAATDVSVTASTTGSTGPDADSSSEISADSTSTGSGGSGPTVVMVTPEDGAMGIDPGTAITVEFSAAMDPASITAADGGCRGAIALSDDDFTSCIGLDASVVTDRDNTSFTVTPSTPLSSARSYRVRVTTAATADDSTPLAQEFSSEGFVSRYFHTIGIDGVDDWNGDEGLPTSTDGHVGRVAWDSTYVYVGLRSPAVASPNGAVWVVFYFGGAGGSTDGVLYNTQSPALPFAARWHLRWRADNLFTDVLEYDGAAWSPGGWAIADGDVYQQGELLELRVARADLDDPDQLELHLGTLREADLDEASWAGCPEGSYVDGYDPDYSQRWQFDLTGSASPAEHVPVP